MRKTISLVLAVLMMLVLLPAVKLSPAVAEDATVTDELTGAWTGVSGNSYADWSGKTSNSDAVYAGQSAGQYDSIQLRSKNNNSGVITTASGGTFQKIVLTWNSNTYGTRVLDVYGKDTAYASPTDLYDSAKCGTLIGSLTYVQDGEIETTLTAEAEYAYIGFRSHDSALYLDKVEITWATGEAPEPPVVEPTGDTVILFTNDVHCGIREGWGYAGLADLKKTLEAGIKLPHDILPNGVTAGQQAHAALDA